MRNKFNFLAIVFSLGLSPSQAFSQDNHAQVDWRAIDEVLLDSSSFELSQTINKSKVVLLDFWASWCGPCRQSFPWMNAMKAKYAEKGLTIIAINLDAEKEDAQDFLSDVSAEFQIAFDPKGISAETLHVEAMPMSYLINTKGEILHQIAGFNKAKKAVHEAQIRESLGLD